MYMGAPGTSLCAYAVCPCTPYLKNFAKLGSVPRPPVAAPPPAGNIFRWACGQLEKSGHPAVQEYRAQYVPKCPDVQMSRCCVER